MRYQVSFTLLSFSPLNSENDSERNFVLASFDSVVNIHEAISAGKKVLVEDNNALMLDLDFGTYPYVTFPLSLSEVYTLALILLPRRSDSPSAW